jgi:hypothetical protein
MADPRRSLKAHWITTLKSKKPPLVGFGSCGRSDDRTRKIVITGAWYHPDSIGGCVNSVREALDRIGFKNLDIDDTAFEPDWRNNDDADNDDEDTDLDDVPTSPTPSMA